MLQADSFVLMSLVLFHNFVLAEDVLRTVPRPSGDADHGLSEQGLLTGISPRT
jgi:hypothetical protein